MRSEPIIGVRELRARLSAYVRSVARGASITIGNRRREPVARLVPVAQSADGQILDRLADLGIVRRGIGKPGQAVRVKPRRTGRLVSDIVSEDRG